MDFIKTSSLRALIELTFQRNWNGLIWMSRKGVTTKRVEDCPDGSIENSAQPRSPAGRGTSSTLGQISSVRLKSRPKSKLGRAHHDPGNYCPRSATPQPLTPQPRTTAARAGKNASRPAEISSAKSHPSDHTGRP
ncbi:unnamed protein product [Microthlaspi erraticum]|uniref:Uncharacterized protein n=1 Tax=Microthlaspi erraticum TaxID=1685480 RepID=A0A6D2IU36_9BRAS|nr:unnamed protein product [Microthlaspi erraticum]